MIVHDRKGRYLFMQARRTSRINGVDFRRLVQRGSNEIAEHWLKAVRADSNKPATEPSGEPLLLHAVPLVLQEILRVIQ